jgi:hypothetical protein
MQVTSTCFDHLLWPSSGCTCHTSSYIYIYLFIYNTAVSLVNGKIQIEEYNICICNYRQCCRQYTWSDCDVCIQTSSLANKFLFISPVIGSDVVSLGWHTAVFLAIVTICHRNHTKLRNMLDLQNANFYMLKVCVIHEVDSLKIYSTICHLL